MNFTLQDSHIDSFYHHGFTVLQGILPPTLLTDLRRSLEPGRAIARAKAGPNAQRLQPLSAHDDELDLGPSRDFGTYPPLIDALHALLSPKHDLIGLDGHLGVFFEPSHSCYATHWHRDLTRDGKGIDPVEFDRINSDATFFVQMNAAVLPDSATWYVPGSANRADLASEPAIVASYPALQGLSHFEAEQALAAYCRRMPGAVQLVLAPGDIAIYRPTGWHLGAYSVDRPRMTLHTTIQSPAARAWYSAWQRALAESVS